MLFSLLIYFIGYKLRAGESEWNELHLVDVLQKGDRAEFRGQTYASVYSPANQKLHPGKQAEVRHVPRRIHWPVERRTSRRRSQCHAERRCLQGGGLCARLDQPALS